MTKTIIEEYRGLTEKIAVIKSSIASTKRAKLKLIYANEPCDVGAIDYAKPKVQTSCSQDDLLIAYRKIHDLEIELEELETELQALYDQRNELEKVINDLGDNEKKCMMLRIKGYPNWKIAKEMNYSVRHIQRIFSSIIEKEKDVLEMSHLK